MFQILEEVTELAFCDLMFGGVCAWQEFCISWSWWLLLFFAVWRNTVFSFREHSKIVRSFRNRKWISIMHRPNCWWYIRLNKCWFFSHGHTILNRVRHTKITVCIVVARHPPNHRTRNGVQLIFHSPIHWGCMNTCCSTRVVPIVCPGSLPFSRNTRKMPFLFFDFSNTAFRQMSHLSKYSRRYSSYLRTSGTFW